MSVGLDNFYDEKQGWSGGQQASAGGFAGGPSDDEYISGITGGIGVGGTYTNADCIGQLVGAADITGTDLGPVSAVRAVGENGIYQWSVSVNVGPRLPGAVYHYQINTVVDPSLGIQTPDCGCQGK